MWYIPSSLSRLVIINLQHTPQAHLQSWNQRPLCTAALAVCARCDPGSATFLSLMRGFLLSSASVKAAGPWHTADTSLSCTAYRAIDATLAQLLLSFVVSHL